MELSSTCMACHVKREEEKLQGVKDEQLRAKYMRAVLKHIAESDKNTNSPCLVSELETMYEAHFGTKFSRKVEKEKFNSLMMELRGEIEKRIQQSADSVLCALKYARVGNYIDFGAVRDVSVERLMELLSAADANEFDEIEYKQFLSDLDNAKSLVYVTDNCGEVILDMLLIQELKKRWPKLKITALVRGQDAINDVTLEDAKAVGLTELVPVIGNGTSIAGTPIDRISDEARELLESADLILAKGQGNFETMHGSGLPIYFAFLCKCELFTRTFGLPVNTGVFKRESQIKTW